MATVGGGEDNIDASGVLDRRVSICLLEGGICDEGGGVIEGERMADEEPATSIEVLGELAIGKSSREGKSAPIGCGVEGFSTGVEISTEEA